MNIIVPIRRDFIYLYLKITRLADQIPKQEI